MKCWLVGLSIFISFPSFCQMQACPVNINFSSGNLTHWDAYTGNNRNGNGPRAIMERYDSTVQAPGGTKGAVAINEYSISGVGIQIITSSSFDYFGGFPTIPVINGYQYNYSIKLGSTAVSTSNNGATGGYIRGISYRINVPATPVGQPYTMTYAYAMVLENGTHNSDEQPMFSATLSTGDSIITCASPSYLLPTLNNTVEGGRGATLDTAAALQNGFSVSPRLSPNLSPDPNGLGGAYLQDVWTKGWREVTFDLSPYRGQQVSLTFESDNCIPGGHFAYAYIALRNSCAGLLISGDTLVCIGSNVTYSIPALADATYGWDIPSSWTLTSRGTSSNIIQVTAGNQPGLIIAKEQNGCAHLLDTIKVNSSPPGVGGNLSGDATVCAGNNSSPIILTGNVGNVSKWIASSDGVVWNDIPNLSNNYTATNLNNTTVFKAVVQNGTVCAPDTSSPAVITVDQKSVGGLVNPQNINICDGQSQGGLLTLLGNTGGVINWQSSTDNLNWSDFNPVDTDSSYAVRGINVSTDYRTIVKNGVCPADTSEPASVQIFHVPFPQALSEPADTTICYGTTAYLNASVTIGTSYAWINTDELTNQGNGVINSTPYPVNAQATPLATTDYVLSIQNAGCPNSLMDTFHVNVTPPIIVDAGRDTAVVANQPLQLNASSNDSSGDTFTWSPGTGLNNPDIPNPVAILGPEISTVKYTVRATAASGCYGENSIEVKVFKTKPDIFVPNAFTPGKSINNIFRPIPVGISSLQYFRIYNRWGVLVYSTSQMGQGWDGTFAGKPQDTDTFVWMVEGTDYTGKIVAKKGTMVLIR